MLGKRKGESESQLLPLENLVPSRSSESLLNPPSSDFFLLCGSSPAVMFDITDEALLPSTRAL